MGVWLGYGCYMGNGYGYGGVREMYCETFVSVFWLELGLGLIVNVWKCLNIYICIMRMVLFVSICK